MYFYDQEVYTKHSRVPLNGICDNKEINSCILSHSCVNI